MTLKKKVQVLRSLLPLTLAALLSGCTTTTYVWRKDGATPGELHREKATCLYNAEVLCGTQYALSEVEVENRKGRFDFLYKQCMKARGYDEVAVEE